jgi:mannose-6-phosphate isomerase-like protein (cupin superfamily)
MMTGNLETLPFPAAVGLTHLRVYDTAASDGMVGGSPHVHLASAEAYIPIAGEGEVQTLSGAGEETFPLRPGQIVWFEPGVIHRLVNADGALEILVVMQNAGLPEAGDAVFTFPDHIMADDLAYLNAATLSGSSQEERIVSALERRNLAVEGFAALITASRSGDDGPLRTFLERATSLRRGLLPEWESLVEAGPVEAARKTQHQLEELQQGSIAGLIRARVRSSEHDVRQPGIGMCGLLRAYLPEGSRVQGAR